MARQADERGPAETTDFEESKEPVNHAYGYMQGIDVDVLLTGDVTNIECETSPFPEV